MFTSMERGTKDSGRMIYNMDMESKPGMMARSMKATTLTARSKDKEFTLGLMGKDKKEIVWGGIS